METNSKIILRDKLALDRTNLANQRTLLSFIRTSLYLVVSGLAVMRVKFLSEISQAGWILIVLSVFALVGGIVNYLRFKDKIKRHYAEESE